MTEEKIEYTYPDGETTAWLTLAEASAEGFCLGCGWMMAGSEADMMSGMKDYCYECVEEFKDALE